ncbi:MAG: hypothetical protein OEZ22_14465 [Spirochaetia bacterium]|nr:hypothetical protein [Spirochaetia bacterium]
MRQLLKYYLLIVFLISLMINLTNCSEDQENQSNNSPPEKLDINSLAKKKYATVGELTKIIRVDKSVKLPSGQYIVLNIEKIRKFKEYKTNTNEELKNIIIIENVTPANITRVFLDKIAFFSLIDEYGNEDNNINVSLHSGKKNTEIILMPKENVDKFKYLIIGGLDSETNNDKLSKIFEIK